MQDTATTATPNSSNIIADKNGSRMPLDILTRMIKNLQNSKINANITGKNDYVRTIAKNIESVSISAKQEHLSYTDKDYFYKALQSTFIYEHFFDIETKEDFYEKIMYLIRKRFYNYKTYNNMNHNNENKNTNNKNSKHTNGKNKNKLNTINITSFEKQRPYVTVMNANIIENLLKMDKILKNSEDSCRSNVKNKTKKHNNSNNINHINNINININNGSNKNKKNITNKKAHIKMREWIYEMYDGWMKDYAEIRKSNLTDKSSMSELHFKKLYMQRSFIYYYYHRLTFISQNENYDESFMFYQTIRILFVFIGVFWHLFDLLIDYSTDEKYSIDYCVTMIFRYHGLCLCDPFCTNDNGQSLYHICALTDYSDAFAILTSLESDMDVIKDLNNRVMIHITASIYTCEIC